MFHPTNKQSQVYCAIVQKRFFFFFFFCATYAFSCVHSFPPFFFPLSFFFHFIFFPLPLCNECLWADRETQSRCLRKIFFFFLVGKHQIPIFETNKSSIESMFKARCRRTNERSCDLGYGDGVLFDSFILDRAPRVIRFFWEVRKKENLWKILFFFLLHLIFKNKLNRHSDVILILQLKLFFGTTKNRILQNKIDYNFTRMELHNVI